MSAGYKWRPLIKSPRAPWAFKPRAEEIIKAAMDHYKVDRDAAIKLLDEDERNSDVWINDLYQVEVRRYRAENETMPDLLHLNIRRRDGAAIIRDWRHFQQIKNEIVGPECEGIELYPAESRKVDTSNKYHLYCIDDPTFRFPLGFEKRDVQYQETRNVPGMRQRPKTVGE